MLAQYKVCMAVTCYKRPDLVKRLVNSIEKYNIQVDKIFILSMPIEQEIDIKSDLVTVIKHEQTNCASARNILVNHIIDNYDYDLIWLTDDDVYYDEGVSELSSSLKIFENDNIGIVSITRRMGNYKYDKTPSFQKFVYIGGGYIFRPSLFKLIEGFDNEDGADELLFTLKSYLAGFQQVRLRNCSAIHEQGKTTNGGIYLSLQEEGANVLKDTNLTKPNLYVKVFPERLKYGNVYGFDTGGLKTCKVSELSKLTHMRNYGKLKSGVLKTSDIPFTSEFTGRIFVDETLPE